MVANATQSLPTSRTSLNCSNLHHELATKFLEMKEKATRYMNMAGGKNANTFIYLHGYIPGVCEIKLSKREGTIYFKYFSMRKDEPHNKFAIVDAIQQHDLDREKKQKFNKFKSTIELVISRLD